MLIKSIKIHNILSIEDMELEFGESGLVLLDGWNYDTNSSNGAGKTSIWNALSFCLYDKVPRKITSTKMLRRKTKRGHVVVELEANGRHITVERHRPKHDVFTVDGERIPTQEALQKYLGLTYEQFLMCMYASQIGAGKFLDLKDTDKKQFFLDLLNLSQFDSVKSLIDDRLSQLSDQMSDLVNSFEKNEVKIDAYRDSHEDEADLLEALKKFDTQALEDKLTKINIDKPDTSQYDDLKSKLQNKAESLREEVGMVRSYRSKISGIDQNIEQLQELLTSENDIECPHCQKGFVLVGENSLTHQEYQGRIQTKIGKLQAKRLEFVELVNSAPAQSEIDKLQKLIDKAVKKKDGELTTYYENKERFTEIKSKIDVRKSRSKDILERIEVNRSINDKILKLQDKNRELQVDINKLANEVNICKTLSSVFSSTGAPAYVLDNVIDTFNSLISDHITAIWPNAQYSILSYKENKSGAVRAKLSDQLIIDGEDVPIGSLSGGELNCICLSIDLALVEIMETMTGLRISPYILDEPFKEMDAANRERAVELLERASVKRQIWIIDHGSEAKAMFSDIVRVEKRNGVSKIV